MPSETSHFDFIADPITNMIENPAFHRRKSWGPVIMAFLCILPSFLLHSTKDVSIRQVMIRRVFQVLMIEGIVLGFLYIVVPMRDIKTALVVAASVVIVYGVICMVDWVQGCMDAEAMNRRLEQLKKEQQ